MFSLETRFKSLYRVVARILFFRKSWNTKGYGFEARELDRLAIDGREKLVRRRRRGRRDVTQ